MRCIFNTTSPVILTLPSPSVTYLNTFFTPGGRRHGGSPRSQHYLSGRANWDPAESWLEMHSAFPPGWEQQCEEDWNARRNAEILERQRQIAKCMMGKERRIMKVLFLAAKQLMQRWEFTERQFIKRQSLTVITGTYLIFFWPWPQPKYSAINVLHKERQDGDFKRTRDKRKIKAS